MLRWTQSHRKFFILGVVLDFHTQWSRVASRFKRFKPLAKRYADLKANDPSLENAHTRMSSWFGLTAIGMAWISLTMLSGRIKDMLAWLSKSILIEIFSSPSVNDPSIWCLRGPVGSQKSSQALTMFPFTMDYFNPLLKITPPTLQAAQMWDAGSFLPPTLSLAGVRYLQIRTRGNSLTRLS